MRLTDTGLALSASDLARHLGCRHLTTLDRSSAEGRAQKPRWDNPLLEVLQRRGLLHEAAYIDSLRERSLSVVEPGTNEESLSPERVRQAMQEGIDVIVQAPLEEGRWRGRADILRRLDTPSELGTWSYEVYDTKLAAETRGGTILQIALYSDLIRGIQGTMPENMHVVTPGDGFPTQTYRLSDFLAYYRLVRSRLSEAVESQEETTYPEPVAQCDVCDWWTQCMDRWRSDDHLSLVAGMQMLHARELERSGVNTLAGFVTSGPLEKPQRGSPATFERLHQQARLQLESRETDTPRFERLPAADGLGLAKLPQPSPGDVFFDIEGDRFVDEGGLEYLFGISWRDPEGQSRYRAFWALDRTAEKQAFEDLVDFLRDRWEADPAMHIYHYAPYEPSALKRLMGRHASREDDVDRLLRGGRFVDLYAVVRGGIRAGVESYSIKDLEALSGYSREMELGQASRARRAFALALGLDAADDITDEVRDTVEVYNRDDCVSAEALRRWLEEVRSQALADGETIERPADVTGEASEPAQERRVEVQAIYDALSRDLPEDPRDRSAEEEGAWLLAQLLDYFRREAKAVWWEYFRLDDASDSDLLVERSALAELSFVGPVEGGTAQCPVHRYRFPPQDTQLRKGDKVHEARWGNVGRIVALDGASRTMDIKKTKKAAERHPNAVFGHDHVRTNELEASLLALGQWVSENGVDAKGPYRAARDLLLRRAPRLLSNQDGALRGDGEEIVPCAQRLAASLDQGVLAVQGPPGSGKTYTGARMILSLLRDGRSVGVTAVSHKVIRNLLDATLDAAAEEKDSIRCVHKVRSVSATKRTGLDEVEKNDDALAAISGGAAVGGTAWLWARQDAASSVDTLIVDEAGQMSLAMVLAMARSAKNLILLGDPQQLEQPQQGTHPDGTADAALVHMLDGEKTMPPESGLFLDETWRLAPKLCSLTSELYYEGRLEPRPGVEQQEILGDSPFAGSGLYCVLIDHEGNQSSAPEEADAVEKIVGRLLGSGLRWRDRMGDELPLGIDDILIVSPYNAQVFAIQERLDGARVGTVDKFQGQEAPIVIYSMAASSAEDAPRGMGFLYNQNRFNVATSRAKCACILVASPRLFQPDCEGVEQMRKANALCRYAELARRIAL